MFARWQSCTNANFFSFLTRLVAFILSFLVKHDDYIYFCHLLSSKFYVDELNVIATGNEESLASKSLLWNLSKNHSRFFGFLFVELCRKRELPAAEIPLFSLKKNLRQWLYTITTKSKAVFNRKWNLASNQVFVWNSPSFLYLLLYDVYQTLQKRSKYFLKHRKKIRKVCTTAKTVSKKRKEWRNLILTQANAEQSF